MGQRAVRRKVNPMIQMNEWQAFVQSVLFESRERDKGKRNKLKAYYNNYIVSYIHNTCMRGGELESAPGSPPLNNRACIKIHTQ